jgi:dTDP-4-dehydrorhamnose 3,5-epimerase
VRGAIFDVVVDIRRGSPDYGNWVSYELNAKNGHQLYIPIGFAHGFVTLVPNSEIVYKCSNYYNKKKEGSILWNDPDINIKWPLNTQPIISKNDISAPLLKELNSPFTYKENS